MKKHPILTALDGKGQLVRIGDSEAGERYKGATPDHQDCELYPVLRSRKLSSYAHTPRTGRADAHRRGQSPAHREACSTWHHFLTRLLSDCSVCKLFGLEENHDPCPAVNEKGEVVDLGPQMFGEIVWVCDECMKVHMWDLLDNDAAKVLRERQLPGFSVRPDITILDQDDRPLALIEFQASYLSDEVKDIADEESIPLFVVDVERVPEVSQMGLQNPRRGMLQASADANGITYTRKHARIDEMSYRLSEIVGQEGGVSAEFSPIPDRDGSLVDVHFHAAGRSPALPSPSMGPYLVAHWSNLKCDSQKRWLGCSLA